MSADNFIKKWIIGVLLTVFVGGCLLYAGILHSVKRVYLGKSFYFLVCITEHIEANALEVRLDGGAGFLLEEGVALAVYLTADEGALVEASLLEQGESVFLLQRKAEYLYF